MFPIRIILALALVSLAIEPAFAQTASTVQSYTIDFTQIVVAVLSLVGTVGAAIATAWIAKLSKSAGLTLDQQQRDAIEGGAESVANMMIGRIKDGSIKLTTKNQAIAEFTNLLLTHYPDALAYFGLDKDPAKLANLIEARLEKYGIIPAIANDTSTPAAAPVAAPVAGVPVAGA